MSSSRNSAAQTPNRQKRKLAYRARHRLVSIHCDATSLSQHIASSDELLPTSKEWPWIPNKQCGSWYLNPPSANCNITPVYFKSTDGHVGTYNFSLKRLNLHLIETLNKYDGIHLIDSSVRKILPDSFSRTIPIWCCVLNRIVEKYRDELEGENAGVRNWDTKLYTPSSIVSLEEHTTISKLIDTRVQLLYDSKAIVDPKRLISKLNKPLRAQWVSNGVLQDDTPTSDEPCVDETEFYTIICYNPSFYASTNDVQWIEIDDGVHDAECGYYYTPGAADDDATWGRGLTHELFWCNHERLLDPTLNDDEVDALIDTLVNSELKLDSESTANGVANPKHCMDKIGSLNLWIGSRTAGKPPTCWEHFDAILNVTDMEYPTMIESISYKKEKYHMQCYYLQLLVAEGKRDKTELERWMPVGLSFLIHHLKHDRRILVHCAQGKDRSVAVVLALVALGCHLEYPLRLRVDFERLDLELLLKLANVFGCDHSNQESMYIHSGLSSSLVDSLLKDDGRDLFLKWMHYYSSSQGPFANKEALRIGELFLH